MTPGTLDELLASDDYLHWEVVAELIDSGQVPSSRVVEIFEIHKDFKSFFAKRRAEIESAVKNH